MTPVIAEPFGLLIGGEWVRRSRSIEVRNPFDGRRVAAVAAATPEDVRAAVAAAEAALAVDFPLHARCDVLMGAAARLDARHDEYARNIANEGSKTIREARREPLRAARFSGSPRRRAAVSAVRRCPSTAAPAPRTGRATTFGCRWASSRRSRRSTIRWRSRSTRSDPPSRSATPSC